MLDCLFDLAFVQGTQKQISKQIFALAWPAIAVNITTPLLSLVDVAVVGHIGNSVYIAAVALGAVMFNTLYWLFGFLRMGTSGLTAQAFGAHDGAQCVRCLVRALLIAVVAGALLIVLSGLLSQGLLALLADGDEAAADARRYFGVAVFGAPGMLVTYALSGWFLGMQTSRPMLWMALIANTLNIALNIIFVLVCRMDVVGVGAATAIAQWVSAGVGIIILRGQLKRLKNKGFNIGGWQRGLLRLDGLRRFFSVNSDIFLRTLCLVAVTLWFTRAGAMQGVLMLAANALLMQLFMLFSYFMDGFAFAGEALVGRFAGAGNEGALRRTVRQLLAIGLAMAVIATVVYALSAHSILGLLTDDPAVVACAAGYKWWAVAVPLAGFASFLWDGVYIGLTRTRLMLASMLVSTAVFFGLFFGLFQPLANNGLWLAFIAFLFMRGVMQTVFVWMFRLLKVPGTKV